MAWPAMSKAAPIRYLSARDAIPYCPIEGIVRTVNNLPHEAEGKGTMRPSYTKSGFNYLPVIVHDDGKREVLHGDPLANGITATKYAALAIHDRQFKGRA